MERLLVATDLTAGAHHALGRACRMARETGAILRVLFAPPPSASEEDCMTARRRLREQIAAFGSSPAFEGDASIRLIREEPASAILGEAMRFDPDIIILGAHGEPRLRDAIFGTTASHVAREAARPVLIVRNDHQRPYRKVLAAVDDDTAEQVLALASRIGSPSELLVVHAYGSATESLFGDGDVLDDVQSTQHKVIDRFTQTLAKRGEVPPNIQSIVEEGEVVSILMKAWEEHRPDLVVLGTHGRSGFSWLLKGSVAETALLSCPFDVLVARSAPARHTAS